MLSWIEAREKVLAGVEPLPAESLPAAEALGRALAAPAMARWSMPPFDNSAMDGFAVRAGDVTGATASAPITLEVIGERMAGTSAALTVGPSQAVRIMTGAPLPEGADAVVPVEDTPFWDPERLRARRPRDAEEAGRVAIRREVSPGANVRRAGEAVASGSVILEAGHRIGGAEIGLLLAAGVEAVSVHRIPRVAVLSTGDELVPPGETPGPGRIPDSNRPALLGVLRRLGFGTVDLGLAPDRAPELESRIRTGLPGADFLITSGGVSVGDLDLTRTVLEAMGQVESYRVAVKPGKPQLFGRVLEVPVFGLPGNPVSSLVVFDQFVLPALKKMAGRRDLYPEVFPARLGGPVRRKAGRVEFLRVRLRVEDGEWVALPTGPQGSGILTSMAHADGYAVLPQEAASLEAGDRVPCQFRGF